MGERPEGILLPGLPYTPGAMIYSRGLRYFRRDPRMVGAIASFPIIALVLLVGLVAFGVGHKRWSWGTLIAAFLVLLTAVGYLYLASRFAAYEWSWARFVRSKQVQLAKVRDALVPDAAAGGRLRPVAGEPEDLATRPIAELVKERERWQRALDRIDTWRGRSWTKASFTPPKADGGTGTLRSADALDGEDVLPGFTLPLPQLWA